MTRVINYKVEIVITFKCFSVNISNLQFLMFNSDLFYNLNSWIYNIFKSRLEKHLKNYVIHFQIFISKVQSFIKH